MTQAKRNRTNFYLILDLMPGVNHNEILHAYNRAKSTYTNGSLASYTLLEDDSNKSILEEIEEAFATLGNPSKRRAYDLEMGFNTWAEDAPSSEGGRDNVDVQQLMRSSSQTSQMKRADHFESATELGGGHSASSTTARVIPMKSGQNITNGAMGGASSLREPPAPTPMAAPDSFFEPNPEFEKKIQECKELTGEFMKAVRIYRNLTPEALAARCKLSVSHVVALENEEHAPGQAPVYLRGHVYLVAQSLDLPDPNGLARLYVERMVADNKLQKRNF